MVRNPLHVSFSQICIIEFSWNLQGWCVQINWNSSWSHFLASSDKLLITLPQPEALVLTNQDHKNFFPKTGDRSPGREWLCSHVSMYFACVYLCTRYRLGLMTADAGQGGSSTQNSAFLCYLLFDVLEALQWLGESLVCPIDSFSLYKWHLGSLSEVTILAIPVKPKWMFCAI